MPKKMKPYGKKIEIEIETDMPNVNSLLGIKPKAAKKPSVKAPKAIQTKITVPKIKSSIPKSPKLPSKMVK